MHTGAGRRRRDRREKFIYDLWGDTVNTASRMESHGQPGTIQVSERTYERLREGFELADRGTIEVKGKGQITTYLLLGRREIQAPARPDVAPGVTPPADAEDHTYAATTTTDRDPRPR